MSDSLEVCTTKTKGVGRRLDRAGGGRVSGEEGRDKKLILHLYRSPLELCIYNRNRRKQVAGLGGRRGEGGEKGKSNDNRRG